jgi:hypothetical protein
VYERILASGSLKDCIHEPCGVWYGDTRVRVHNAYPSSRREPENTVTSHLDPPTMAATANR